MHKFLSTITLSILAIGCLATTGCAKARVKSAPVTTITSQVVGAPKSLAVCLDSRHLRGVLLESVTTAFAAHGWTINQTGTDQAEVVVDVDESVSMSNVDTWTVKLTVRGSG